MLRRGRRRTDFRPESSYFSLTVLLCGVLPHTHLGCMSSDSNCPMAPTSPPRSFLLIVRTGRIVSRRRRLAPDTNRSSQHIARFCNGLSQGLTRLPGCGPLRWLTVIVTAAVHRGFGLGLISPPLNLPAPGRCQPLYLSFRFGRDLCFC